MRIWRPDQLRPGDELHAYDDRKNYLGKAVVADLDLVQPVMEGTTVIEEEGQSPIIDTPDDEMLIPVEMENGPAVGQTYWRWSDVGRVLNKEFEIIYNRDE